MVPTRIMNSGTSGRVIRAMTALSGSRIPMVSRHSGVTVSDSISWGT